MIVHLHKFFNLVIRSTYTTLLISFDPVNIAKFAFLRLGHLYLRETNQTTRLRRQFSVQYRCRCSRRYLAAYTTPPAQENLSIATEAEQPHANLLHNKNTNRTKYHTLTSGTERKTQNTNFGTPPNTPLSFI